LPCCSRSPPAAPTGGAPALAALVVAAAAAFVPRAVDAADPAARTHEIVIQGLKYIPETLTVKRGDVVVWVNKDPFPHTATAAGTFDSKSFGENQSWRYTAKKAGTFPYLCTLHSNMKGVLRVE
jgi:plastocyanin